MSFIKKLAGRIYFVYAMILFVLTMLIVFIPIRLTTLLPEPRRSRCLHLIFRIWMGIFLPLAFCPVRRKGRHHFRKGENYVVVCNHNSLADIPVSSPWIPGPNKTLAKKEMARIPVFGAIYKAGSVLVDRKSQHSKRDSMLQMQAMLDMGLHLCLYPEGTRNKSAEPLQPFYDGAFRTAIEAQKDIIPTLIFNTGRILPHHTRLWARPLPIRIHFLEPVSTKGLTLEDVKSLKEDIYNRMRTYYIKHSTPHSCNSAS